jgi:hypothetical protein
MFFTVILKKKGDKMNWSKMFSIAEKAASSSFKAISKTAEIASQISTVADTRNRYKRPKTYRTPNQDLENQLYREAAKKARDMLNKNPGLREATAKAVNNDIGVEVEITATRK